MIGKKVYPHGNPGNTGIVLAQSRLGKDCVVVEWDYDLSVSVVYCNFLDEVKCQYVVYDNDRPASSEGYQTLGKGLGFDNHKFDTFEAAVEYAQEYLGVGAGYENSDYKLNKPLDYNDHGDFLIIKEEPVS